MMSTLTTRHKTILCFFLGVLFLYGLMFGKSPVPSWNGKSLNSSSGTNYNRVELEDLDGLDQNNPFLIQYLRQYHVYPPSTRAYRYSTLDKARLHYINESRYTTGIIQSYLKNMTNGVFVEAGANNGADELSNTLVLERDYNWMGLLVEGSPTVFPKLIAAHRKSWKSDLLLSKFPHAKLAIFNQGPNVYAGKEWKSKFPPDAPVTVMATDGKTPLLYYELLTVPLYSLLAASKLERIDYLSLDLEGNELEILMNFPFDKVLIRTMMVEVHVMGKQRTQKLVEFLSSKGYYKHPVQPTFRDMIFIHKSVMNNQ